MILTRCAASVIPSAIGRRTICSSVDEAYDVAIVGAGMVGAALAAALSANPMTQRLKVALVDHQVPDTQPSFDGLPSLRVSTIVPGSIRLIKDAGAWEGVAPPHSAAFDSMQVWDNMGPGFIRWSAAEVGMEHMGVVVENHVLQAALLNAAQRQHAADRLHTYWSAAVTALDLPSYSSSGEDPSTLAKVQLKDGPCLMARLVVGADGANSRLRTMAGFRTSGWSYGQRGLVATVSTVAPSSTAWQRFLPTGPLALLPVREGLMNVVWSTTPEMATKLAGMNPREFGDAVDQALQSDNGGVSSGLSALKPLASKVAGTLSQVLPLGSADAFESPPPVIEWVGTRPASFPLQLKYTGRYTRPRFALLGDAAHAVHPLAGQGVNLGLGDAKELAAALAFAVERGMDLGSPLLLQDYYETPRQRQNTAMMAVLDGLLRTFSVQSEPLALLRSCGVGLVNMTGPIKAQIMKYAMGV